MTKKKAIQERSEEVARVIQEVVSVNLNLRESLDLIRHLLNKGDGLQDVLAAMRGPDFPDDWAIKKYTTGILRAKAFGGAWNGVNNFSAKRISEAALARAEKRSGHFAQHVADAAKALGIGPRT